MITSSKDKVARILKSNKDRIDKPSGRVPTSPEHFNNDSKSLMGKIRDHANQHNFDPEDFVNQTSPNTNGWLKHLNRLQGSYKHTYEHFQDMSDEAKLLARLDAEAHRRAVFYRVLSTALIGLTIMGIYWLANCLDIPMPLRGLNIS